MRDKPLRAMWLLNHTSARNFEVPMLKSVGVDEVFLPKKYPGEIEFRSASVSFEEDAHLTIPAQDLATLNAQDWYGTPSREAWDIANEYFDILFFIFINADIIPSIANHFNGAALWRTYGVAQGVTYDSLTRLIGPNDAAQKLTSLGRRFWFAEAYPHLHKVEPAYIAKRRLHLPVGLANTETSDRWSGGDERIFFICPNIATNSYYRGVFDSFCKEFAGFPYAIGGAQAVDPRLPEILGFVSRDAHERNMREFRVMFYHSIEPNHIHYHPFEAVRAGMPLVFMAGGLLDRIGGRDLPGRCRNMQEARRKVRRILDDDRRLIERIRESQTVLLESMRAERCRESWRAGIRTVVDELDSERRLRPGREQRRKRVAVIVPIEYRGGTWRGAKLIAEALLEGSRQWDETADIVFLYPDSDVYAEADFDDLAEGIPRRSYSWKTMDAAEARRAMRYAGHSNWEPAAEKYMLPDDGIAGLLDCDAWFIVSDRLTTPLLPLRPYQLMVYDYLQRYIPVIDAGADRPFIEAARNAARVIVTTDFTYNDALQYAGILPHKLLKLPMLAPQHRADIGLRDDAATDYFLWTTNAAPHKNHEHAVLALKIYYEELGGSLKCKVTGVHADLLLDTNVAHLVKAAQTAKQCRPLRKQVRLLGELSDARYRRLLANAAFLWHPALLDNGTFSVVEAAALGVPALSSDYPAMREMDRYFALNLEWMDAARPRQMAAQLKAMESSWRDKKNQLPSGERLAENAVHRVAPKYWGAVRECL